MIISNLVAIAMASVCMSYFVFLFLKGDYHSDVIQRCCVCSKGYIIQCISDIILYIHVLYFYNDD